MSSPLPSDPWLYTNDPKAGGLEPQQSFIFLMNLRLSVALKRQLMSGPCRIPGMPVQGQEPTFRWLLYVVGNWVLAVDGQVILGFSSWHCEFDHGAVAVPGTRRDDKVQAAGFLGARPVKQQSNTCIIFGWLCSPASTRFKGGVSMGGVSKETKTLFAHL